MKLSTLVENQPDIEISGITADSREVKAGFLFGSLNSDEYVDDAVAKGATAVIVSNKYDKTQPENVVVIKSTNPVQVYAEAVAKYFGAQPKYRMAITGTNGKTSIADFVRQVLTMMGEKAASIGTLGLIKGNNPAVPSPNTTPNNVSLHRWLKELADENFAYLILEASSHGLHQGRLGGVSFDVAGFTNLTRDHLDYHKTFDNYLEAKLILFKQNLKVGGTAVLNADIDVYKRIVTTCQERKQKIISYGFSGSDIRLLQTQPLPQGQRLKIKYFGKEHTIDIPLAGDFQAMNVLCALGILAAVTGKPEEVLPYISKIKGAKGRLEFIGTTKNGAAVYIDYAHTPDALENVLKSLRAHTQGKLRVVFGCGGNRDKGKRPIMGSIAAKLAEAVYVTDDNPRFEEADDIRNEIMAACPGAKNIGNRAEAIRTAVDDCQQGDVLVVAGKGHETGQYIKGEVHPFSDHEEVLKAMA
ncbi:MAG: UDP-N-acetylmuramoyl-L-alanyl-D-glutamate--2,6-diaminopimelate ligase [Alphaproteobacteria bacterium]|nr:UDP-N-acetylmuramoyl-L-alanyl-D-glutamate--2,6-diaminopimelate ligase [Alphaproteobacteria bacterium]